MEKKPEVKKLIEVRDPKTSQKSDGVPVSLYPFKQDPKLPVTPKAEEKK